MAYDSIWQVYVQEVSNSRSRHQLKVKSFTLHSKVLSFIKGGEAGEVVQQLSALARVLRCGSQHCCQAAHSCLCLQLQGHLTPSEGLQEHCTHIHVHVQGHTHN